MTAEQIQHIRTRLAALEAERAEPEVMLRKLEHAQASSSPDDRQPTLGANKPVVTASSSSAEKVALFRHIFVGRTDIFPARWDNRKTGRSGYSPACANEWAKGVCGKPQIKCGECPHQAFMTPSRRREPGPIDIPLPKKIGIVVADQLYIDRSELPPAMTARIIRLAAFQNPEFYRSQAMRLPTFGKPRIISCAELHPRHVGLPRGCLGRVPGGGVGSSVAELTGRALSYSAVAAGQLRGWSSAIFG